MFPFLGHPGPVLIMGPDKEQQNVLSCPIYIKIEEPALMTPILYDYKEYQYSIYIILFAMY